MRASRHTTSQKLYIFKHFIFISRLFVARMFRISWYKVIFIFTVFFSEEEDEERLQNVKYLYSLCYMHFARSRCQQFHCLN